MIVSFKDEETRKVFLTSKSKRLGLIARMAARRLGQIEVVDDVQELRAPPGNHLERLSGDRAGQWSIGINDQYRVCFKFEDKNAFEVEIVDYH